MSACIPETLLSLFSRFVEEQIGLHFPKERWADLERGIRAVAREFGSDNAEECILKLMASPSLTKEQMETLAASLTIGETYFFRDKRVFEVLETDILPGLIQSRRGGERRLRIWSAGCCTGEEPYSVAMVLARLLPDIADWRITIVATDINARFLRKAAQGIYGEWSFRETPAPTKEKFFRKRDGGRFEILPGIKDLVSFAYLNLAEDVYPALANNTNAMDLIFCRNVLMYFSPDKARTAARKLARSLVEGGWFISSPSEASADLLAPLLPGDFPGAILYRKPKTGEATPPRARLALADEAAPLSPCLEAAPAKDGFLSPQTTHARPVPAEGAPETSSAASKEALSSELSLRARAAANRGDLAAALLLCDKAISADRLLPASHYLRGVILQEQGALEEATASLKRALYLDQSFVVAHFALGNILRRRSGKEARRHFESALVLLRRLAPDAALPEAEGITAGRLLEIILATKEKK